MQKILYLHGLESPPTGDRIDFLKESNEIYAPNIDYRSDNFFIKVPDSFQSNWEKNEAEYIEKLKKYITDAGYTGKNAGEILEFQVADGYAKYMVTNMRPLMLIHIPLGDAYEFQFAHLLTSKEVNNQLESAKRFNKFFLKK